MFLAFGEHHRREFVDSAPPVILGAAAARTKNIRLTRATTYGKLLKPRDTGAYEERVR
jgi:alkanesulfonate monooxygenase SsuD/methylene tetrahydromethanopterin reductase-like flavin-dependent oxidoreductase (luciferase family)